MDQQGTAREARATRRLWVHARDQRPAGAQVLSAWTSEEDALKALSARQQQIRGGQTDRSVDVTFGHVAERYLKFKSDHGKRSLHQDKWILEKQLLPAFGAGLPIRQLSAEKTAAYEERRITEVSAWTVRNDLRSCGTCARRSSRSRV